MSIEVDGPGGFPMLGLCLWPVSDAGTVCSIVYGPHLVCCISRVYKLHTYTGRGLSTYLQSPMALLVVGVTNMRPAMETIPLI